MARIYGSSSVQARLLRQLLASASVAVICGGAAQAQTATPPVTNAQQPTAPADQGPAPAAEATTAPGQEVRVTADDIVVTGYRRSIETSLARKRDANAFIDVITAEDVGKFPDKNVADSLQRVPGVVIERDGGEGSRVSIRGRNPT